MITVNMLKRAINAYNEELVTVASEKSIFYALYETLLAEDKDVLENPIVFNLITKQSEGIYRRHHDHDEYLSTEELYFLVTVLIHYKDYADTKLFINKLNKEINISFDYVGALSLLLDILSYCKKADLLNNENLSRIWALAPKPGTNGIYYIHGMFCAFSAASLPLTQKNLDALIELSQARNIISNHIYTLIESGLLKGDAAQANFSLLAKQADKLNDDGHSLYYLLQFNLLSQSNFEKLMQYPHPQFVNFLFNKGGNELLNQPMLDIFFGHPELGKATITWNEDLAHDGYRVSREQLMKMITDYRQKQIIEDEKSNSDAVDSADDSYSSSGNYSPTLFAPTSDNEFSSSTEEEQEEVQDLRQRK